MPWQVGDVEQHKKGLTDAEKRQWVAVANSALAACLKEGRTDCEASAIKQANGVVEEARHEHEDLGELILKAAFTEASFKATLKAFLVAAKALVATPGIPKKYADQIAALNTTISTSQWAKLATEDAGGTQEAVRPSEGIREALQSIARRQVRSRLREMSLGGVSVAEFETKLNDALAAKLGANYEFRILDVYETMVIFAAEGGMWGAPYTISLDGTLSIGKPVRVKRICRYIPIDETVPQEQLPGDREGEDEGGQLSLPGDWWKYTQDGGNDGRKVLGSTPGEDGDVSGPNEAMREDGAIVTQFVEDGALVEEGENDG
jgi:hypothetical protein